MTAGQMATMGLGFLDGKNRGVSVALEGDTEIIQSLENNICCGA